MSEFHENVNERGDAEANRKDELLASYQSEISRNAPTFLRDKSGVIRNYITADALPGRQYEDGEIIADLLELLEKSGNLKAFRKLSNEIERLKHEADEDVWADPKQYTADAIERRFIEEGEHVMLPSGLPRVGGIINLPVEIDENQKFHAREYTIEKPGKEGVKQFEKIRFDFGGLRCPEALHGSLIMSFYVEEKKGGVVKLEAPRRLFAEPHVVTRPIAYDPHGFYTMSDGYRYAISDTDKQYIDGARGYAIEPDGMSINRFPVIEMSGVTNNLHPAGDGLYYGRVLGEDILRKRLNIEDAFAQYYRKRNLGELQREQYVLAPTINDLDRACAQIREASQKTPLDIVVSVQASVINKGFDRFGRALDQIEDSGADVTHLRALKDKAQSSFAIFEKQSRIENSENLLNEEGFWDDYILFFKQINSPEVSQMFAIDDVRQRFFSSDLDGETAIEFFGIAGVRTTIFPFTPDVRRGNAPYIQEAIHLDISHGTKEPIRSNPNAPWKSVTVFLDENDEDILSSTHATYDHLRFVRLLNSENINGDLAAYLIQLVNEEDSYSGFYETQQGCRDVVEYGDRNVYGFGGECIRRGRYDVVINFLRNFLPVIKRDVAKMHPEIANDQAKLQTAVLRKLLTFDMRNFAADFMGNEVGVISRELEIKKNRSKATIAMLEKQGYAGETRFGKTLFDPFGVVPHRGLGAFAVGYDCYISYGARNKAGIANLARFRTNSEKFTPDLFENSAGELVGAIIKDGTYFVMNSSGGRLDSFEKMVEKICEGHPQPEGVQKYFETESMGEGAVYEYYNKLFPGLEKEKQRESRAKVELSFAFNKANSAVKGAVEQLAKHPNKHLGTEAIHMRRGIVDGFKNMQQAAQRATSKTEEIVCREILESAQSALYQDADETLSQALRVAHESGFEDIARELNTKDLRAVLRNFLDLLFGESGLAAYSEILPGFKEKSVDRSLNILKNL